MTKRNSEYFVYLIRGGDHVKIGITSGSPMRRLKTLQTGNPVPLELIDFQNMQTSGRAARVESNLHKRFDNERVNGEWFDLNDEQIGEVKAEIRKIAGSLGNPRGEIHSYGDLPLSWQDYLLCEWRIKESLQYALPRPQIDITSIYLVRACNGNYNVASVLGVMLYECWLFMSANDVGHNLVDGVYKMTPTFLRNEASEQMLDFDAIIEYLEKLGFVCRFSGDDQSIGVKIHDIWDAIMSYDQELHSLDDDTGESGAPS